MCFLELIPRTRVQFLPIMEPAPEWEGQGRIGGEKHGDLVLAFEGLGEGPRACCLYLWGGHAAGGDWAQGGSGEVILLLSESTSRGSALHSCFIN